MSTHTTNNSRQRTADSNESTTSLGDILSDDDRVDNLTEIQVKDAYVRQLFMHKIIRGYTRSDRPMLQRERDDIEKAKKFLETLQPSGLKQVAYIVCKEGRSSSLYRCLGNENGPGNVETLYERWTNKSVEEARESLKLTLRQCTDQSAVVRERVSIHNEFPNELTK